MSIHYDYRSLWDRDAHPVNPEALDIAFGLLQGSQQLEVAGPRTFYLWNSTLQLHGSVAVRRGLIRAGRT
jgi:hypothetical protein